MAKSQRVPMGLLKADPKNPRTISDEAMAGLEVSIESFGDLGGVVWTS